jgi:hypothetical protein
LIIVDGEYPEASLVTKAYPIVKGPHKIVRRVVLVFVCHVIVEHDAQWKVYHPLYRQVLDIFLDDLVLVQSIVLDAALRDLVGRTIQEVDDGLKFSLTDMLQSVLSPSEGWQGTQVVKRQHILATSFVRSGLVRQPLESLDRWPRWRVPASLNNVVVLRDSSLWLARGSIL